MQNPELAAYKILQGKLIQALSSKDPVQSALEQGINEQDLPLLQKLAQDRSLQEADGPFKWLPGLAYELLEEFSSPL